jgi:hypothetical protein
MAQDMNMWPTAAAEDEDLYAVVDSTNGTVKYLVFTSLEENSTLVRDNGTWIEVFDEFFETIDDPDLYNEDVDVDYIDYYDKTVREGKEPTLEMKDDKSVTAAAAYDINSKCPPATQDISVNLRNRRKAIRGAGYGPLNPQEENAEFWNDKAEAWSVSIDDAKKSLCGNCAVFVVTSEMKSCIARGLEQGGSGSDDAWDAIDAAQLGYCEAFDFKCAASRTCDAWVTGGPITDDIKSSRGIV